MVHATSTGNLATILTIAAYISLSEDTLTELGLKETNALVKEAKTPIGWADFGKPSKIFFISSST